MEGKWLKHTLLIIVFMITTSPGHTCSPEYDPFYEDMISRLNFEPDLDSGDPIEILQLFYANYRYEAGHNENENKKSADEIFLGKLNKVFVSNNRKIKATPKKICIEANHAILRSSMTGLSTWRWETSEEIYPGTKLYKIFDGKLKEPKNIYNKYIVDTWIGSKRNIQEIINTCLIRLSSDDVEQWKRLWSEAEKVLLNEELKIPPANYAALAWGSLNFGEYAKAEQYLSKINSNLLDSAQIRSVKELEAIVEEKKSAVEQVLPRIPTPRTWGRCTSNENNNIVAFIDIASADKTVTESRISELLESRIDLQLSCEEDAELNKYVAERKLHIKDVYDEYLLAIALFYAQDFISAKMMFRKIAENNVGQMADLSSYMIARSSLAQAEPEIFDKGRTEETKEVLHNAEKEFNSYIHQYPNGQYVKSATGLIRRTIFLRDERERYKLELIDYINEYSATIIESWTSEDVNEFSTLLLELYRLNDGRNLFSWMADMLDKVDESKIEDEKKSNNILRLKEFLGNYNAYDNKEYRKVIDFYKDKDLLVPEFSLLVRAREQLGEWQEAVELWKTAKSLYKKHQYTDREMGFDQYIIAEYEIAKLLKKNVGIRSVINEKEIENEDIKINYLAALCGVEEQKSMLRDDSLPETVRRLVFSDIAKRSLYHDKLNVLNEIFKNENQTVISNFDAIKTATHNISNNISLGESYRTVGEFLEELGSAANIPSAIAPDANNEECSDPSKHVIDPYYYYNKASLDFNKKELNEEEARILHILTYCGKYWDACHWYDTNKGLSSKEAFKRLHKKYPESEWAKKTRYYY